MRKRQVLLSAATIGVVALGVSQQVYATSYASGLTVSGTTVTFDLNESVSGSVPNSSGGQVTLVYNGTTQNLGALSAGIQSFTLNSTPTTPVQVMVTTNDAPGYFAVNSLGLNESTALEVDPPGLAGTPDYGNDPYGIAVNTYPNSPYFGRIYLGNYGTNPGLGIYIENADGSFQGVAPGTAEAAGFQAPFNAGIPYSGADGPYNLQVGSDGYLYVSDWSDGSGGIYREQEAPVVGTGASATGGLINGENVLAGYGEPNNEANGNHDDVDSAVIISGSTAAGNLQVYAVDTHYGTTANPEMANQPYVWNVGGTTLTPVPATNTSLANLVDGYTGAPTAFLNQNAPYLGLDTRFWSPANLPNVGPGDAMEMFPAIPDVITNLARGGPANQFYVSQSRSNAQQPGLFVLSSTDNNTVIWDSLDETMRQQLPYNYGVDFLLALDAVQTSPDGRFIAVGQGSGAAYLTPYNGSPQNSTADFGIEVMPLLAGIPDLKLLQVVKTALGSNRQIAFDSADNIYTVNATDANEQVWGPGGTTTTITGSNGTYTNSGMWTTDANGNLSNTSNWQAGNLPNGNDQALTFGAVTTAQRTVSVDSPEPETAGSITFSSPNGYVLSGGGGSITMNGFGVNFNAQAGANTISAPVSIQTDVGFYVASGASLNISNPSNPNVSYSNSPSVVKNGPGTLTISNLSLYSDQVMANNAQVAANWSTNVQAAQNQNVSDSAGDSGTGNTLYIPTTADSEDGNLDIYQGKVVLAKNSGAAVVSELSVYTGASLDLTNNDLIYDYNFSAYTTQSPLAVVEGLVASGTLFSSSASLANGTALAIVENDNHNLANNAYTTFDGHPVNVTPTDSSGNPVAVAGTAKITTTIAAASGYPASETVTQYNSGTILLKYTYYGDLNLDGVVDTADEAMMGDGVPGWSGGDLNYATDSNGNYDVVNADDWSLFALGLAEYNKNGAITPVPEPASLALIGLAAIPMIRRRRV